MRGRHSLKSVLLLGVTLVALCAAGPASGALPAPKPNPNAVALEDLAVGGGDVFWIRARENSTRFLLRYKQIGALQVHTIAHFREGQYSFMPWRLYTGGGYAFVYFTADRHQHHLEKRQIVRFGKDGARKVIATSRYPAGVQDPVIHAHGTRTLNDCGTHPEVEAVSEDGVLVIDEISSDRESARCGRKPNVDHHRYFALWPDGRTAEVFSFDKPVTLSTYTEPQLIGDAPYGFSIAGEKVAFVYGGHRDVYVRDLSTGALTGPIDFPVPGRDGRWAVVGATGRLIMSTLDFSNKGPAWLTWLMPVPGDPTSIRKVASMTNARFCGDHLVMIGEEEVYELDPGTGIRTKTISNRSRKIQPGRWIGCDSKNLYLLPAGGYEPLGVRAVALR